MVLHMFRPHRTYILHCTR